jgi:phosphoglycolate phosphatase
MENKIMIKLVAFDLDGTTGETIPLCIKSFKDAVYSYSGKELSDEDIIQTFGLNVEGMMKKALGKGWERALNDYYILYQKMHIMCPEPFEGIKELITKLKIRHVLATLVTGKGKRTCQITLQQFGMENCFDAIETGSPDKNIKTEALINLQNKYELSSDELVYVGDTVSDVISCKQAGVQCLSAAWAKSSDLKQLQEYNEGYVFQTIQSLQEYIFNHI